MLMFTFHIAFALGLMALTFGLMLKKWCKCCCKTSCETTGASQGACKGKCSCIFGLIIVILALLSLICTGHAGYCYWKAGAFKMPAAMEVTSETIDMHVK